MYLNLVREIKTAITNSESLPSEFLVELANEYSQACDNVNEKLLGVSGLLKTGCRDEAVQVAEHPRSLLESVRELNFGSRKEWIDVLSEKKMELPPRLDFHSAVMLEKAYEKLEELAPLLKKNRLLALAQAPLQSRILILKKLADKDPENQVWKMDLVNLQEARLRNIRDEHRVAVKRQDSEKLAALMEEVQGQWDVEVPSGLAKEINASLQSIGMESHLQKMAEVAKALNQSLVETDAVKGVQLRQRFLELNRVANLDNRDPLINSIREPMAWLRDLDQERASEREHAKATAELELAMAAGAPVEDLDKRIALVENFKRDSSADLLEKAKGHRKSMMYEKNRQSRLLRYAIIGVTAVGLLAAGWFGLAQSRNGQIVEAREKLRQMVQQKSYAQGVTQFEQWPGFVQADSEVAGIHDQLKQFQQAEESRKNGLSQLVKNFSFDRELGAELDDELAQGRSMATTPEEKQQLEKLKKSLDKKRLEKQTVRSAVFLKELAPLETELQGILGKIKTGTATPSALKPVAGKIETLTAQAEKTTEGLPGISSNSKSKAVRLMASATSVFEKAQMRKQSSASLGQLTKSVARLDTLGTALERFISRYPNDPNVRQFEASAAEASHLSGFDTWLVIARMVKKYPVETLSRGQLVDLQSDIDEAIERTYVSNWRESVEMLRTYLRQTLTDNENVTSKIKSLESFFSQKNYTDISVIERDGSRYYLVGDYVPNGRKFSYFVRGIDQRESKYRTSDLGGKAGHCRIADDVLVVLEKPGIDLDTRILKLLEKSLAESKPLSAINGPTIDPLVQCDMVARVLKFAEEVSPNLTSFAEKQRRLLQQSRVTGQRWRDVTDKTAAAKRPEAVRILAKLRGNLAAATSLIESNRVKMQEWVQLANYRVVGLLYRQGAKWVVDPLASVTIQDGQPLYCLIPGRRNDSSLEVVGKFDRGSIDKGNSVLPLQAGRPVFVLQE